VASRNSVAISSAAASCSETHNAILHVPAGDGPFPLLVYLHGGFWKPEWTREATGSAAFLATFTSPPAEVAAASPLGPVATLSVEYARVAQDDPANSEGGGGFPGTQLDVLAAVNEVASLHRAGGEDGTAGAAAARLDLGSVFLAGHSAGGQMALWLGLLSALPAQVRRAAIGEVVGRSDGGPALAEVVAAGVDPAISVAGVLAIAPVCDLVSAAQEGLSDFHDAVPNLLWRFGHTAKEPAAPGAGLQHEAAAAACPVSLLRRLPPLAAAPRVLLVHGDRDTDVPPSQSLAFAAAAWGAPGDHATSLLLARESDHLEPVGILVTDDGSPRVARYRRLQAAMRHFVAAGVAARCHGMPPPEEAEARLSPLCCTSLEEARGFCAAATPHACAAATVAAIEAAAAGGADDGAAETLAALNRPADMARGLLRWFSWVGREPGMAVAAWVSQHVS